VFSADHAGSCKGEEYVAVLRYIDPCPGLPCCTRRPRPAECRPKFISVIAWGARPAMVYPHPFPAKR